MLIKDLDKIKMPFGIYQGKTLNLVPEQYLICLYNNSKQNLIAPLQDGIIKYIETLILKHENQDTIFNR
jgi:uncharacterized protein (DUF3820 family)